MHLPVPSSSSRRLFDLRLRDCSLDGVGGGGRRAASVMSGGEVGQLDAGEEHGCGVVAELEVVAIGSTELAGEGRMDEEQMDDELDDGRHEL